MRIVKHERLVLLICVTFCAVGRFQNILLETCLRITLTLYFTQLFLCVLCAVLLCASLYPTENLSLPTCAPSYMPFDLHSSDLV